MNKFKIRASAIGQIMTGTVGLTDKQEEKLQGYYHRAKHGKPLTDNMKEEVKRLEEKRDNIELPKTVINYLYEWWIEQKYGRTKEFTSKYTEKGLSREEDSITLLSAVEGAYYEKNEEHFENEYMTGTPDILFIDRVIDVKSSWDIFTFFQSQRDPLNTDYEYQLQAYMHLSEMDRASLVYCLVNTPSIIIDKEINRLQWQGYSLYSDDWRKAEKEIHDRCLYDDIPKEERVYRTDLTYDPKIIKEIEERVDICRTWIEENLEP